MKFTEEQKKLYKLKEKEIIILNILEKQSSFVNEIVLASSLPRMSIYLILDSLIKRGLVAKNKKGGRWIYSTTSPNLSLTKERNRTHRNENKGNRDELEKIKLDEMYENYVKFVNENFGARVLALQTTKSFNTALEKMGETKWKIVNNLIKKNEIVIDAIVPENVVADSKKGSLEWKETIIGRKTSVKTVPDFTMDFNAEIFLGNKWGMMTNWETETQIIITDKNILEMLKMFIFSLRGFGKSVDVHSLLKE
jgi:sugar-specific transcriptional regulator TrmB